MKGRRSKLGVPLAPVHVPRVYFDWLDHLKAGGLRGGGDLDKDTEIRYLIDVKIIQVFISQEKRPRLDKWTRKDFEALKQYLKKYKYTNNRIRGVIGSTIGSFYNYLYYIEEIADSQLILLSKIPKPKKHHRKDPPITGREWEVLFKEVLPKTKFYTRNKAYFMILRWTMRRASEPLALTWDFIDFDNNLIGFPETKGGGRIEWSVMHPDVRASLLELATAIYKRLPDGKEGEIIGKAYKTNKPLRYDGKSVFQVSYSAFYRCLYDWRKKYPEIERLYLHLTRASGATEFFEETGDLVSLKKVGGWKSNIPEEIYIRRTDKAVRRSTDKWFNAGRVEA